MYYQKARALGAMFKYWGYDIQRHFKHLNYLNKNKTIDGLKGLLSMNYHVIEKGLTMPEPRLGFGESQLFSLLKLLNEYYSKGLNPAENEFVWSVRILNEYLEFHKINNYQVSETLINEINKITYKCNILSSSAQLEFDKEKFFSMSNSSFDQFAISRHSIRNYSPKEISDDIILSCVRIAQNAPSSCNRQPIRVYAVKENSQIKKILELQSGNRGFGHLTNVLFIITSNLNLFQDFSERNEPALNAGMFSMTLLYALHFHGIGACSLNWSVSPERDKNLRNLMKIPDNEQIHLIISSGYPPKTFKVAASPRNDINYVLNIIK